MAKTTIKILTTEAAKLIKAGLAVDGEALIKLDANGLLLRMMDSSQISMVSYELPKARLIEYDAGLAEGQQFSLIRVDAKGLKRLTDTAGESISIELADGKLNALTDETGTIKRYTSSLLEPGAKDVSGLPKVVHTTFVTMTKKGFTGALKDLMDLSGSKHLAIAVKEGVLTLSAFGDKDKANITLEKTNQIISLIEGTDATVTVPIDFVLKLLDAINSTNLKLEIASNKPLILRDCDNVNNMSLLAPRISEE